MILVESGDSAKGKMCLDGGLGSVWGSVGWAEGGGVAPRGGTRPTAEGGSWAGVGLRLRVRVGEEPSAGESLRNGGH